MQDNPATAITRPNTVIISESMARKYFGNQDPVGKQLTNVTFGADFEITGVFRDFPGNTHFKADFFCSLSTLGPLWGESMISSWHNSFLYSYVRIPTGTNTAVFERQLTEFIGKQIGISKETTLTASVQPLTTIHLGSHRPLRTENDQRILSDQTCLREETWKDFFYKLVLVQND